MKRSLGYHLRHRLLTIRFPFQVFAVLGIFYLSFTTAIFTYKAGGEIWEFFSLNHIASSHEGKLLIALMSILVGIGTLAQTGGTIWQKLGFWGQKCDNFIIFIFTRKEYFLDVIDQKFKETRKMINQSNAAITEFYWHQLLHDVHQEKRAKINIRKLVDNQLTNANDHIKSVIKLLEKNDVFDKEDADRKLLADRILNDFISQIKEINSKLISILEG